MDKNKEIKENTCQKNKENEGQQKTKRKKQGTLGNAGKQMKKTKKIEEEQWTNNEHGGKPLKMHGTWRKTIGKLKEKLARTKNEKHSKTFREKKTKIQKQFCTRYHVPGIPASARHAGHAHF